MNDLRNTLQLSLICRQKESSLSCSGSPVYERLSIPPQLQWWHCTWWAAHGGLTVCIHFHGTSSASLLSLYRSFVGILGTGISNDELFPYWHVLKHTPTHGPEMLALIFFISWWGGKFSTWGKEVTHLVPKGTGLSSCPWGLLLCASHSSPCVTWSRWSEPLFLLPAVGMTAQ